MSDQPSQDAKARRRFGRPILVAATIVVVLLGLALLLPMSPLSPLGGTDTSGAGDGQSPSAPSDPAATVGSTPGVESSAAPGTIGESPAASAPPGASAAAGAAPGGIWRPAPGTSWQWQLDGEVDLSIPAKAYDIDGEDATPAIVQRIHQAGAKAICYISAGTREDWRSDRNAFPASVLGKDFEGWAGERFLDIRRLDVLMPIMLARVDMCAKKGFDGIEFDILDSFEADTGFPLTVAHQTAYDTALAKAAHQRGLAAGYKNTPVLVKEMEPHFDFMVAEECYAEGWCDRTTPFLSAGKAVFDAEYTETGTTLARHCSAAGKARVSLILKNLDLEAWRQTC